MRETMAISTQYTLPESTPISLVPSYFLPQFYTFYSPIFFYSPRAFHYIFFYFFTFLTADTLCLVCVNVRTEADIHEYVKNELCR